MAGELERVRKALRELGKSLESLHGESAPKDVHKLRTASRRVEAIAGVLQAADGKKSRRLVKSIEPVRKAAGGVREDGRILPTVLTEVRRINDDWRARADQRHRFLAPGDIVPVLVDGGTWDVTYPAFCHLTLDCHYLPAHWHPTLGAAPVKAEIRERIDAAAAAAPWLAEHPIAWQWEWEVPPAEIAAEKALRSAAPVEFAPGK